MKITKDIVKQIIEEEMQQLDEINPFSLAKRFKGGGDDVARAAGRGGRAAQVGKQGPRISPVGTKGVLSRLKKKLGAQKVRKLGSELEAMMANGTGRRFRKSNPDLWQQQFEKAKELEVAMLNAQAPLAVRGAEGAHFMPPTDNTVLFNWMRQNKDIRRPQLGVRSTGSGDQKIYALVGSNAGGMDWRDRLAMYNRSMGGDVSKFRSQADIEKAAEKAARAKARAAEEAAEANRRADVMAKLDADAKYWAERGPKDAERQFRMNYPNWKGSKKAFDEEWAMWDKKWADAAHLRPRVGPPSREFSGDITGDRIDYIRKQMCLKELKENLAKDEIKKLIKEELALLRRKA